MRSDVYLCAFVGSLHPPLPARPHPLCLSFLGALSDFNFGFVFFSVPPWSRSLLLTRAPRVPPALLRATTVSPPRAPLPRLFPLPSAVSLQVLPVFLRPPSLPLPCCHSCVPRARSTPAPLCRPYPVPWWLTYPCVSPSVPVSLLFRDAMVHCVGGGRVLADWIVALLVDGLVTGRWDSTTAMSLDQHSSTVPHSTCTSASCESSRSAPNSLRYPSRVPRPAAQPLSPHPSALPYSAAPFAPAAGLVPSAGCSRLCPPSPHLPPPPAASLPFPAHLRPSAPFLLSLRPSHPPLTLPHLRRLPVSSSPAALLASRLPVPPALPWPLAPGASRSCSCPVLRLAPIPPLPLQQLPQHPSPEFTPLLLGTVQVQPRERLSQHPPPLALLHLWAPFPGPPCPANQVAEGVGPPPLLPSPRPACPLHVADQLRHSPRRPPRDCPGPPPYWPRAYRCGGCNSESQSVGVGSGLGLPGRGAPSAPPAPRSSNRRRFPLSCPASSSSSLALFPDGDRPSTSMERVFPSGLGRTRCAPRAIASSSSRTLRSRAATSLSLSVSLPASPSAGQLRRDSR